MFTSILILIALAICRTLFRDGVGIEKFWGTMSSAVLILRVLSVASLSFHFLSDQFSPVVGEVPLVGEVPFQCVDESPSNHFWSASAFFFCRQQHGPYHNNPESINDKAQSAFQIVCISILIIFESRVLLEVMFPLPMLGVMCALDCASFLVICNSPYLEETLRSLDSFNPLWSEVTLYLSMVVTLSMVMQAISNVLFRTYLYRCLNKERLANQQAQDMKNQLTFLRSEASGLQDRLARIVQRNSIGEDFLYRLPDVNSALLSIAHILDSLSLLTQIECGKFNFNSSNYIMIRNLLHAWGSSADSLPTNLSAIFSDYLVISNVLRYLNMHGTQMEKMLQTRNESGALGFSVDVALVLFDSEVPIEDCPLVCDLLESPIVSVAPELFTVVGKEHSACDFTSNGAPLRFFLRMRMAFTSSLGLKEQSKTSLFFGAMNAMVGTCGIINILVNSAQGAPTIPGSTSASNVPLADLKGSAHHNQETPEYFQIDYFVPCVPLWSVLRNSRKSNDADLVTAPTSRLDTHRNHIAERSRSPLTAFRPQKSTNYDSSGLHARNEKDIPLTKGQSNDTAELVVEVVNADDPSQWDEMSVNSSGAGVLKDCESAQVVIVSSRALAIKAALSSYFPFVQILQDDWTSLSMDTNKFDVMIIDCDHKWWVNRLSRNQFKGLVVVVDSQVNRRHHFEEEGQLVRTTCMPFPFDTVDISLLLNLVSSNRALLKDQISEEIQSNAEVYIHRHRYSPRSVYVPVHTFLGIQVFIPRVMREIWSQAQLLTSPIEGGDEGFSFFTNFSIRIASGHFEISNVIRSFMQIVWTSYFTLSEGVGYIAIMICLLQFRLFRREICTTMRWTQEQWLFYDSAAKLIVAVTHLLFVTTLMIVDIVSNGNDAELGEILFPRRLLLCLEVVAVLVWSSIDLPPYNYLAAIALALRPILHAAGTYFVLNKFVNAEMETSEYLPYVSHYLIITVAANLLVLFIAVLNIHRQDFCRRPSFAKVLSSRAYMNMLRDKANFSFKELRVALVRLEGFMFSCLYDFKNKVTRNEMTLDESILTFTMDFARELKISRIFQSFVVYFEGESLCTPGHFVLIREAQRIIEDVFSFKTAAQDGIKLLALVDPESHLAMGRNENAFRSLFFQVVSFAKIASHEYNTRHDEAGCVQEILFGANLVPIERKYNENENVEPAADTHILKLRVSYRALPNDSISKSRIDLANDVGLISDASKEWMHSFFSFFSEHIGGSYSFEFGSDGFFVSTLCYPCTVSYGVSAPTSPLTSPKAIESVTKALPPFASGQYYTAMKAPSAGTLSRILDLSRICFYLSSNRRSHGQDDLDLSSSFEDEKEKCCSIVLVDFGDKSDSRLLMNAFVVSNCECLLITSMQDLQNFVELPLYRGNRMSNVQCIIIEESTNRQSLSSSGIDLTTVFKVHRDVPILALTSYLGAVLTSTNYSNTISRPVSRNTVKRMVQICLEHLLGNLWGFDIDASFAVSPGEKEK
jgi:hypothetical protein